MQVGAGGGYQGVLSPDACYPGVQQALAWAKMVPVEPTGWLDVVSSVGWDIAALWFLSMLLTVLWQCFCVPELLSWRMRWVLGDEGCLRAAPTFVIVLAFVVAGIGPAVVFAGIGTWGWLPLGVFGSVGIGLLNFVISAVVAGPFEERQRKLALRLRAGTLAFLKSRSWAVATLHEDSFGRLVETRLGWGGPVVRAVIVKCSTSGKEYALRVEPDLYPIWGEGGRISGGPQELTAHNAVASTFGLRGEDYAPMTQS